ncbi:RNA polymerase sigma factor [Bythopirellula polymerisocia]|uniref:ECF RNA polymerase sigma factor SigW n=1 Tax=Bythopirellula polymerisocia TaxID=2528003 RepID=A0A5C6CZQ6_9BACT|nr:sigma-70 family RNA polymerase sigma factor [Bythopirellula polymerisocia]TWU30363.1 ECF RNA polymerase sigma factor SigW [Bythopirellula polymerisocia]
MSQQPWNYEPLSSCGDAELARRLQAGCESSFAELDRRFRRRLLFVLTKRLPRREDAEDVVQKTMLRVFQKIHLFDTNQRLSPWVFTIAMRLSVEHGRRKQLPSSPESAAPLEIADESTPPEKRLDDREERDRLWSLAGRVLKPEQWTALWLHYGEELSIAEVAQTLGKTKTAIKVLLFRARKALLPHLQEKKCQEPLSEMVPDTFSALVEANS